MGQPLFPPAYLRRLFDFTNKAPGQQGTHALAESADLRSVAADSRVPDQVRTDGDQAGRFSRGVDRSALADIDQTNGRPYLPGSRPEYTRDAAFAAICRSAWS